MPQYRSAGMVNLDQGSTITRFRELRYRDREHVTVTSEVPSSNRAKGLVFATKLHSYFETSWSASSSNR
jgi:hypothetical protein